MPRAAALVDALSMASRTIRLEVDVTIDGPLISGVVTHGPEPARTFSGRLGLIAAIERAIDEPSPVAGAAPERDD